MQHTSVILVSGSGVVEPGLHSVLLRLGFSVAAPSAQSADSPKDSHVVLIDGFTLPENPRQFEALVREHSRRGPVLVLAREDHMEQVIAGLRGGAVGFLEQASSPRELRAAIRAVAAGGAWCDINLLRKITRYLPQVPSMRRPRLTKREEEVLSCLEHGDSNREIARKLGVTPQSVKVYVSNLLRKTGATNRKELGFLTAGQSGS